MRPLGAVLSIFLLLVPAPAQAPPPAKPAPGAVPQPVIHVSTHLVQVNVVVHGRKGDTLTDLTRDDFEILDSGVRQKIATLSVETTAAAPGAPVKEPAPLPVDTFTNRASLRPKAPKAVTAILLDGLNTKFEDQTYARQQLVKFLKEMEPQDRVAIYRLGNDLKVLYDFTNDVGPLLQRLNNSSTHIGPEVADSLPDGSDSGDTDVDAAVDDLNQALADFQVMNRVQTTLAAIEAIANHVARIPGRKNLIWISGGFPFSIGLDSFAINPMQEQRSFSEELERTARAVNAANLAIYPVDARGLIGAPDYSATTKGNSNWKATTTGPSKVMSNITETQLSMSIIAQRTGGKAYMNTNDLKTAIREAIDDAKVTYVLGYYPSHGTWDGQWRPIKVTCARKGVELRYRLGYFAFEDQPQTEESRKAAIHEAVWDPLDETMIGLTVRAAPNVPKEGTLRVVLLVSIQDLQLQRNNDRYEGNVDVVFVKQAAPFETPTVLDQKIGMHLTQAQHDAYLKEGMLLVQDLKLPEAAYKLKVMLRDTATGNVGSVNIRTDKLKPIPPESLAAEPKK